MNYISYGEKQVYWPKKLKNFILEGDMEEFVIKSMIDNGFI